MSLNSGKREVIFGGESMADAPVLHFLGEGVECRLARPILKNSTRSELLLQYEVATPQGAALRIERTLHRVERNDSIAWVETFRIRPSGTITQDLEVEIPLSFRAMPQDAAPPAQATPADFSALVPLKNGWAKTIPLGPVETQMEYRLGNPLTGVEVPQLALPVVHLTCRGEKACLFTDPSFSSLFTVREEGGVIRGCLRFRYTSSQVPLAQEETRTFAVLFPTRDGSAPPIEVALDAWFGILLADVPPGPAWLHDIAIVGYDFVSDEGLGWERDVKALTEWLTPEERGRVALCFHGWYDALGSYCFEGAKGTLKQEWIAFERTRKVPFTQEKLKNQLRLARAEGFRVLLYFADGLAADSGYPGYQEDWAYRDLNGNKISGWQGPDTFGPTYLRNPAHREVSQWYEGYLDALLAAYGAEVDGFVWDETFHARTPQITLQPEPAYCDRAMLALVRRLTARVEAFDPQKVFLASDCSGVNGWEDIPGYAMMADGAYQDSHCDRSAWSYGFFPNWRNVLWSCNWGSISSFKDTRWGVETFGVPVAISNGWGDDRGPSEWTAEERTRFLDLFRGRLQRKERVRWLEEDPAEILKRG